MGNELIKPGVLDGIYVIEMGHWIAVPAAAAVMADWGARVLKVEPPDGDAMRHFEFVTPSYRLDPDGFNPRFELHNRGKKSLTLNLKCEEGAAIIRKLVSRADVFLSNYEVSVLRKFRLDYESLKEINPGLVYGVLTAYGREISSGDERGFDFTAAWARSGLQHLLAEGDGVPPQQRSGMMDRVAAMNIVSGVTAALFCREKTGQGQELEFSLYHAGIWANAGDITGAMYGEPVVQNDRRRAINPLWNAYRTKDGYWIELAMLRPEEHWTDFCRAIGRPELKDNPRFADLKNLPDFSEELVGILGSVFATRTLPEWEEQLGNHNCIFSRVATIEDVLNDSRLQAGGIIHETGHDKAGKIRLVSAPVGFVRHSSRVRGQAPFAGQHNREVLTGLGYRDDEIDVFRARGVIT